MDFLAGIVTGVCGTVGGGVLMAWVFARRMLGE